MQQNANKFNTPRAYRLRGRRKSTSKKESKIKIPSPKSGLDALRIRGGKFLSTPAVPTHGHHEKKFLCRKCALENQFRFAYSDTTFVFKSLSCCDAFMHTDMYIVYIHIHKSLIIRVVHRHIHTHMNVLTCAPAF